jgi:uncharacterized protein YcfJ
MKKFFALVTGVSVLAPAQGQLFTPEGLNGAAWGGLMGGIIGHNSCGNNTGEGIAIGAGAGFLLGTLAHHSRAERAYYSSCEPASVQTEYSDPNWCYEPAYYEAYRPSRAFEGAVIGGIAGGIIGDNNHHHGLEGAAIGIGAGLLLGGLADHFAYRRERARRVYTDYRLRSVPAAETTPAAAPPPQTNTVDAARLASPMSGVNALFGR